MTNRHLLRLSILVALLLAVGACGGTSTNPLAPTAPAPDTASAPAPLPPGASIRGTVTDGSGSSGFVGLSASMTVTVVGTSISTRVSSDGRFALENVPTGDIQLRFEGPGADATLTVSQVQAGETINVTVSVSGSTAAVENQAREAGTRIEVEGRIDSIAAAARTFVVAGRTVQVTDATEIRHGSQARTFDDLKVGDRVHVRGTLEGGVVTASRIELQNPAGPGPSAPSPGTPDPGRPDVAIRGAVAGLSGTCPNLSFNIERERVRTDRSTTFSRGNCDDLRNGEVVEVEGSRQTDGSILAKRIRREERHEPPREVELRGPISGIGGTCPSMHFTVDNQRIRTDADTAFSGTRCGDLRNGQTVEVKGIRQDDGSVLARRVKAEQRHDEREAKATGTVGSLTGTCPNLAFTVGGHRVATNAATRFEHTSCTTLRNEDRVEVEGVLQSDGIILARKVERHAEDDNDDADDDDDNDEDDENEGQEAEVRGVISNLGGACPALSFSVGSQRVSTNASTRFERTSCRELRNGMTVEAEGARQPDGSILAKKVKRE